MKAPVNLSDMTERVNLYLDKALTKDDENDLLREVDDNPSYRSLLDKERDFRHFIKTNVTRSSVSPDLIKSIKDKIKIV